MTIELGQKEPEPAQLNKSLIEYEDMVKITINQQISVLFLDYGLHLCCQTMAAIALAAAMSFNATLKYTLPCLTYFVSHVLVLLVRMLVSKKEERSSIRSSITLLETVNCLIIIAGIFALDTPLFFLPFLAYTFVFLAQVVFYCMNFADSLDQTFLFKLVGDHHSVHGAAQACGQIPDIFALRKVIVPVVDRLDQCAHTYLAVRVSFHWRRNLHLLHLPVEAGHLRLQKEEERGE